MKARLAAGLALALVVVPGAVAKPDLRIIRVCGPAACAETRDGAVRNALRALSDPAPTAVTGAPALGHYYVIRGGRGREAYGTLVPGRSVLRWSRVASEPSWMRARASLLAKLELLSARLRPFAPPRPVRAVVNGRLARDAEPFARLLGELQPRPRPRAAGPTWIPVTVLWNRPNPWTSASSMFYDPDDRAIYRGGAWYHVPPDLVGLITRR